jgi:chaperonin GroES
MRQPQQVHELENSAPKPLRVPYHTLPGLPKPLHDRVLVKRIEEEEKCGAIFIPDSAKTPALKARVLAVGPGRYIDDCFYPTQVKEGQTVLLSPSVNRNWPDIVEGSGMLMIQEADILGVIE